MDVSEAIHKRRALRKFDTKAVEAEKLASLVGAMRLAPSCNNNQPWRVVVCRDPESLSVERSAAVLRCVRALGCGGGREEIESRTVIQEKASDIFSSHMSCRTEPGFKITTAPIPAGVDQCRLLGEQFLDAIQIAVRVADKFLNE